VFEDLTGKVALVTGGARGLGLGMARALASQGVRIGLVDLLDEVHGSASELATSSGVDAVGETADLTDAAEVERAFSSVERRLDAPIDILINSAGVSLLADAIDIESSAWQRVMNINLGATWLCAQAIARRSRDSGRPSTIVNVASMSSFIVNVPQHQTAYNVSKAAVSMLTQCLAIEWMPIGVRVNAIAPGYFASDMTKQFADANPAMAHEWIQRIPVGRMGEPQELGGLVAYLASDESAYVYGQSIIIDGGFMLV
jgi:NAD(P)-dependent dehydrogenase (short-subunit alcohol dehydrogenase family)